MALAAPFFDDDDFDDDDFAYYMMPNSGAVGYPSPAFRSFLPFFSSLFGNSNSAPASNNQANSNSQQFAPNPPAPMNPSMSFPPMDCKYELYIEASEEDKG